MKAKTKKRESIEETRVERNLEEDGEYVLCFQRPVSMFDASMRAGCASTRANRNVYTLASRSNNAG